MNLKKKSNKLPLLVSQDNFLDIKLINQINSYVDKVFNNQSCVWRSSHSWAPGVRRATNPVSILDLPDEFTLPIRQRLKKTSLTWTNNNLPHRSMYYIYPPGGYIAWHDDGGYDFASIIFLNPIWNLDWGGLFLYDDLKGLGIRSEVPDFNRCVIHTGGIPHAVSIVAPDAPLRRVIVTLGPSIAKEKKEAADKRWTAWTKKRNFNYRGFNK